MRIAVVDDVEFFREEIIRILAEKEVEIDTYENAEDFLNAGKLYQLVFLDVEMKQMNGFEAAEAYKRRYPDALVCIVTVHSEMVREGYKVKIFRFLYKENLEEEIEEAYQSAMEELLYNKKIEFRAKVKRIEIAPKEIVCGETLKRNVLLHTSQGEEIVLENIGCIYEKIKDFGFITPHESFFVNERIS